MLGGRCVICGTVDDLEFDHIDPQTKVFTIACGLDRPRPILVAEAAKCQLLCCIDHKVKTKGDGEQPNRARGERVAGAKLTANDVREIRISDLPTQQLALLYGVCISTIQEARAGRTWRHVA
jgi:hypothetical protein